MTAVEWYFEQIRKEKYEEDIDWYGLFEQAKAMEKEQHQETFKQARLAKIFEKDMSPVWESWEQYYNETFKSE